MRPLSTFLSSACARAPRRRRRSGRASGSPALSQQPPRCARTRAGSSQPSSLRHRAAITMPSATASPCSQRRSPPRASIAWPNVWPRFSSARSPVLALVPADDRGLDLAAAADRVRQRRGDRAPAARSMCASSHAKNAASRITPYLMTSARPARDSRGGSVRACRCRRARRRLVERADHVLAARMIDAGLAADRRVDLREQRRRHLHEIDAALVAGGGESGDVADHAAAERHDGSVAVQPRVDERVDDAMRTSRASCAARRPAGSDVCTSRRPAARAHRREVERRDGLVAHDQDFACRRCAFRGFAHLRAAAGR